MAAVVLTSVSFAEAQQPKKVPRIGLLNTNVPAAFAALTEAFRQGLRELGYVEGKTILIEYRYADGKFDRLPALADELVRLKVDVIVAAVSSATRSAKEATSTIPIVMAQDNDPVETRHVASLARPGGNVTGLSSLSPEIGGKQLELLNEIVPHLARAAAIGTSTAPAHAQRLKEVKLVAQALTVPLQYLDVLDPMQIETAFREASKGRVGAVVVLGGRCSLRTEYKLQTSRQQTGFPRYTTSRTLWKTGASCLTERIILTCGGAPPFTWTRSSEARSRPTYPWSGLKNLS